MKSTMNSIFIRYFKLTLSLQTADDTANDYYQKFITTYQSSDGHRNNIVLEHLDGSTVAEISLKSNSKTYYDIDLKTKKELFKEMVFAIDNLHNKANVCHRSLSLSSFSFYSKVVVEANLFSCVKLTPSFKGSIDAINNDEDYFDILIKLTDFAFSTSINDKFIESVAEYKKGLKRSVSLSNITPEMVSGAKAGDCRKADTWALGVILYGLLYGKEPFTGLFVTNKDQTINAIRDLKYKIPYRWKKDTKAIALLKRLLVKDPNERADISEVMSSEWLNS